MQLFPATGPRRHFSLLARAVNFRLPTFSPRFSLSFNQLPSARGDRRSIVRSSAPSPPSCGFLIPPVTASHRNFCSSAVMASKIDGTAIAKSIREGLKAEIEKAQESNPRFKPNLVIFQGKLLADTDHTMNERLIAISICSWQSVRLQSVPFHKAVLEGT